MMWFTKAFLRYFEVVFIVCTSCNTTCQRTFSRFTWQELLWWFIIHSFLSLPRLQFLSRQVQVRFLLFFHAHKFFQWHNVDIISQVKKLWRGALNIVNLKKCVNEATFREILATKMIMSEIFKRKQQKQ